MPSIKKLNLGCGGICYEDFINIDRNPQPLANLLADIKYLPFKDNCVDMIAAHHCFEHIPRQQTYDTFREWYRVLEDGGILDIECPNFDENCRDYIKALDNNDYDNQIMNKNFIYGGDDIGEENAHRWGYSEKLMKVYLKEIGFVNIEKAEPTKFYRDQAVCFRVRATK